MFNSLTGSTPAGDQPPDGSRHRATKRHLRAVLTLASAAGIGMAMMVAAQPAQAITNLDGHWTVVHGGTGQLSLNADGTYTSTCQVTPGYKDAWCPAPSGTFERNNRSFSYVNFHGDDGSTTSYRYSGDVSSPDTITSMFGSRGHGELIMKPGNAFVCTSWSDTATGLLRWGSSPLVEYDAAADVLYATGSHDLIGPRNVATSVSLAETAPNYFQLGQCGNLSPKRTMASFLHINTIRDATKAPTSKKWSPRAIVTIHDLAEVPVSGATVSAGFTGTVAGFSCVTAADGTCTLGNFTLPNSVTSTDFRVNNVAKAGSIYMQGSSRYPSPSLTIYNPLVGPPPPPPPPAPVTYHVSDLDSISWTNPSPKLWEPQVTVTVSDSDGYISFGTIVTGTFSHHSGTVTCTTNGAGTCTVGNFTLNRSTKSTVFTVTGVDPGAGSTYVPAENSDPDGDSNGTSITVKRP